MLYETVHQRSVMGLYFAETAEDNWMSHSILPVLNESHVQTADLLREGLRSRV